MCSVTVEQINKPKMKIVGIQNIEEMNKEQLQQDINMRNFAGFKDGCIILHMYTNDNKGTQTAVIEVTADIYKHVRDNKNKIYVRFQKCMACDIIDVKPCFNCGRHGHKRKKFLNNPTCIICAGTHRASEYEETVKKCTNCTYSNSRYNTRYEDNHEATDYKDARYTRRW